MSNIIALLTDFGSNGQHYIASMKGVILKINPDVKIVDIVHNVSSFSILNASFLLKASYKHFPEETIFIIVVDPGVGSKRNILAIKTKKNYYFIGPDNGIFPGVLSSKMIECVRLDKEKFFNKPISNTFHGRDIMSPIAAQLSKGIPLKELGTEFIPNQLVQSPSKYELSVNDNFLLCTIQHIDSFGNIITNIPIKNGMIKGTSYLFSEGDNLSFRFKEKQFEGKFVKFFANAPFNSLICLKGSSNFLEISINQGNAAAELGANIGDEIEFTLIGLD